MSAKKNKYVIDGLFFTKRITGIERYAFEMVKELDDILDGSVCVQIAIPTKLKVNIQFRNIQIVEVGSHKGILWEQVDFARYLYKEQALGIFLCNSAPVFYMHGFLAIHDVILKARPDFFQTNRDRLSMMWHRMIYRIAAASRIRIITVSKFSQQEIERLYHVPASRISVIYDAWQHMDRIAASDPEELISRYPYAKKGTYYFSMSSLMPNKNFKWIIECAKQHPNEFFLIAGGLKLREAVSSEELHRLHNLIFLGYVADSDAKALMRDCKAFLAPTFYEGFGMTPLEAIASGANRLILSDIPVFHEIYGPCASYIDPYHYEKCLLDENDYIEGSKTDKEHRMSDFEDTLKRYSWKKSAERLKMLIETSR